MLNTAMVNQDMLNHPGVDLIGPGGTTYESKVTQFKNKSQITVRNFDS